MRTILREPLFQFLLLGLVLTFVLSRNADDGLVRDDRIVITAEKIDHLAGLWMRTWKRPPTPEELDGLVRDHLREELAYREGLAVGLDRDDTIIRRRIRQKMEFIADDIGRLRTPTDADLQAYLDAHPESFRRGPVTSFRQVYFNPDRRGERAKAAATGAVATLRRSPDSDLAALGDGHLFRTTYADQTEQDITANFGREFANGLAELEPGRWAGPVPSAYGLHAVIVDARIAGHLPPLDDIRADVRREWEHTQKTAALDRFYEDLAAKYEIVVEWDKILAAGETP